jgi:dTDP-4-amino-4,6-dideoxygalactose transaminase
MVPRVPFNKPFISGKELYYVAQSIVNGKIAGDGRFTSQCARLLEEQFDVNRVLMTPSCTAALEMAATLCDLREGDEVILPSYTFVSTANAFVRLGAKPIFVDVRRDTLNIDEELIEDAITPRTKAIFPVHYAGVSCEMNRIMEIAEKHNLLVVEDAAQGVNASYEGQALGSIGHLGAYSFHETKNYVCGEGGALCVNDSDLVERAEIIREKGTDRSRFFRGMVDKYTWVDVGSSHVPSELCSAFLLAQLEMLEPVSQKREALFQNYSRLLKPLEAMNLLELASVPEACHSNYHMFYVLLPDVHQRDALMASLKHEGIVSAFHYVPLHLSPMGANFGYRAGDFPVTEEIAGRLLRLPFYFDLSAVDQLDVVDHITRFVTGATKARMAA